MRSSRQLFLSYALLAVYAGISILGEGLHFLTPDDGHHHHAGINIVSSIGDRAEHAAQNRSHSDNSPSAALNSNDHGVDSHVCGICEFLYQAISQPAERAPDIEAGRLIAPAAALRQSIYTPTSLGCQAPRGPPSFSA